MYDGHIPLSSTSPKGSLELIVTECCVKPHYGTECCSFVFCKKAIIWGRFYNLVLMYINKGRSQSNSVPYFHKKYFSIFFHIFDITINWILDLDVYFLAVLLESLCLIFHGFKIYLCATNTVIYAQALLITDAIVCFFKFYFLW